MPKKLPIVHESRKELLELINSLKDRERRNRIHALFLIKTGQYDSRKAIAETLNVSRQSVEKWISQYEQNGLEPLISSNRHLCGRKSKIQGEVLSELQEKLNRPEGFPDYQSICSWLKERFDLVLPYKTVHNNVHYRLKAKSKVARRSSVTKAPRLEEELEKKSLPDS